MTVYGGPDGARYLDVPGGRGATAGLGPTTTRLLIAANPAGVPDSGGTLHVLDMAPDQDEFHRDGARQFLPPDWARDATAPLLRGPTGADAVEARRSVTGRPPGNTGLIRVHRARTNGMTAAIPRATGNTAVRKTPARRERNAAVPGCPFRRDLPLQIRRSRAGGGVRDRHRRQLAAACSMTPGSGMKTTGSTHRRNPYRARGRAVLPRRGVGWRAVRAGGRGRARHPLIRRDPRGRNRARLHRRAVGRGTRASRPDVYGPSKRAIAAALPLGP